MAAAIAITGIGVLMYPWVKEAMYARQVAQQKQRFMQRAQIHRADAGAAMQAQGTAYAKLYEHLRLENRRLYETGQAHVAETLAFENIGVDLAQYGIEDNCIGYIELPTINMQLPIYLGANSENMQKGAVHLTQTSYPIGGPNTNSVIGAHRDASLLFLRNIDKIALGDPVYILNLWEKLTYRAVEIKIIAPSEVGEVLIQDGRELLTLFSCEPLGHSYQRYVLYCERVN